MHPLLAAAENAHAYPTNECIPPTRALATARGEPRLAVLLISSKFAKIKNPGAQKTRWHTRCSAQRAARRPAPRAKRAMGRPARRGDALPVAGQGSLLGFLRRAPLAAANDIANARELDSPTVAAKRERREPTDAEGTAGDPAVEAAADATATDAAEGEARAPARLRPPVRMADALERIARNVERWATVFLKLEDATVNVAAREETRARRDADARAALSKRAYEYRVLAYARTNARFRDAPVEDDAWKTDEPSDANVEKKPNVFPTTDEKNDDARKRKTPPFPRNARNTRRTYDAKRAWLRRSHDAFGLSLGNMRELGVTHLPRARRETTAAAAFGDPAVSVAFDASGGFLAAACASGGLCVLPFDTLRVSDGERFQPRWTRRGLGDSGSVQRTLSSVAWGGGGAECGAESAFLATTSPDSDAVEVLDARVGRTARVVSSGGAGLGSGGGARTRDTGNAPRLVAPLVGGGENEGLLDVCFAPGAGGVSFAASGRKGRVFLWDARCAAAPRATLHAPGASSASSKAAVRCVRFGCDGQTVLAGTGAGEIHVWDLRGGSGFGGGASKGAAGNAFSVASRRTTSFPVLRTARVADALALAPTLRGGHLDAPARRLWQDAMRSGVDWCEQDPHDPRRVGFHLNSGWSGVLDLASGDAAGVPTATHAHCPEPLYAPGADGAAPVLAPGLSQPALAHRRTAAWLTNGAGGSKCAALLVGCPGSSGVRALDFSPTPTARRWIAGVTEADLDADERFEARAFRKFQSSRRDGADEDSENAARKIRGRGGQWWPDAPVATSGPAVAVAAHPGGAHAACGTWNALLWMGPRRAA